MAESLDAELVLDTSSAQSSIDDLIAQVEEIVIQVVAETGDAEAAISGLEGDEVDVPVTADTAEAESAISDLGSDAPEVDIPVTADTEQAETSISSLGDTAGTAAGGVDQLAGSTEAAGAAAGAATGSVSGLTSAVGSLGGGVGTAVGVMAGLGAAVGAMFAEALNAEGVTQRFNQTLGSFAGQVDNIHVGNLNTDISSLAVSLGSSDEAMREAGTNAFLFAKNAGVAGQGAAGFSSQILALAARAVALNPALGDVGDAASQLQRALVTGREKALLPFNLGLDKTVIASRAAEFALARGSNEVSGIDKAMAAASLATEKFGNHLEQDIARGVENPIIQLRRLKTELSEGLEAAGGQLVAPGLDLLGAAVPGALAFAEAISALASSAMPLLTAGLAGVVPLLESFSAIMQSGVGQIASVAVQMQLLSSLFERLATSAFAGLGPAMAARFGTIGLAVGAAVPLIAQFDQGLAANVVTIGTATAAGAALGTAIGGPGLGTAIGAGAGALFGLGSALGVFGESAEQAQKRVQAFVQEISKMSAGDRISAVLDEAGTSFAELNGHADAANDSVRRLQQGLGGLGNTATSSSGIAAESLSKIKDQLVEIAQTNPGVATQALKDLGESGKVSAQNMGVLTAAVQKASGEYLTNAANARQAEAATKVFAASVANVPTPLEQVADALGQMGQQVPTLSSAFQAAARDVQALGLSVSSTQFADAFINQVNEMTQVLTDFPAKLQQLPPQLATFAASLGPQLGGAFADSFINAGADGQAAAEEAVRKMLVGINTLPPQVRAALLANLPPALREGIDGATTQATATPPAVAPGFWGSWGTTFGAAATAEVPAASGPAIGQGITAGVQAGVALSAGNITTTVSSSVGNALAAALAGASGFVSLPAATLGQRITQAVGAGAVLSSGTISTGISGAITTGLAGVQVTAGGEIGTKITTAIGTGVSGSAGPITTAINGAVRTAVSSATSAAQSTAGGVGRALTQGAGSGVTASQQQVGDKLKSAVTKAITDGESEAKGASKIGTGLAEGVASGITSSSGKIGSAMRAAVRDAIQAGISAAQNASPSKLTRDLIGEPLGQGIAVGIDKAAPDAQDAMAGLVTSAASVAAGAADTVVRSTFGGQGGAGLPAAGFDAGVDRLIAALAGNGTGRGKTTVVVVQSAGDAATYIPPEARMAAGFLDA